MSRINNSVLAEVAITIVMDYANQNANEDGWFSFQNGGLNAFLLSCVESGAFGELTPSRSQILKRVIPQLTRSYLETKRNSDGHLKYKIRPDNISLQAKYGDINASEITEGVNDFLQIVEDWIDEDQARMNDGFTAPETRKVWGLMPEEVDLKLAHAVITLIDECGLLLTLTENDTHRYRLMRAYIEPHEVQWILTFRTAKKRWPHADEWLQDGEELAYYLLAVERVKTIAYLRAFKDLCQGRTKAEKDRIIAILPKELRDEVRKAICR